MGTFGIFGNFLGGIDSIQRWQWQPETAGKDPSPPINLEYVYIPPSGSGFWFDAYDG